MKILATDLDRTLLPNGRWESDESAISLFNELTEKHDTVVVYVTGRNLDLTERAIQQYGVRHPNFLCGDVGTTIRKFENGEWRDDEGWFAHVKRSSPRWEPPASGEPAERARLRADRASIMIRARIDSFCQSNSRSSPPESPFGGR